MGNFSQNSFAPSNSNQFFLWWIVSTFFDRFECQWCQWIWTPLLFNKCPLSLENASEKETETFLTFRLQTSPLKLMTITVQFPRISTSYNSISFFAMLHLILSSDGFCPARSKTHLICISSYVWFSSSQLIGRKKIAESDLPTQICVEALLEKKKNVGKLNRWDDRRLVHALSHIIITFHCESNLSLRHFSNEIGHLEGKPTIKCPVTAAMSGKTYRSHSLSQTNTKINHVHNYLLTTIYLTSLKINRMICHFHFTSY